MASEKKKTASPVIAIDGPAASGKGTVAARVAGKLGFHYLDSGALYRVLGTAATLEGISLSDEAQLAELARSLPVRFRRNNTVFYKEEDITLLVRSEQGGHYASLVATLPEVRTALLQRQRSFQQPPGLVADGRDMGSVVFPKAILKIFLTASAEIRAERRYKQLMQKGVNAIFTEILADIEARDARDMTREVAPLKHYPDAFLLDTTLLSIEEAVEQVLHYFSEQSV